MVIKREGRLIVRIGMPLCVLLGSILLSSCSVSSTSSTGPRGTNTVVPNVSIHNTIQTFKSNISWLRLPPSRDNDAGQARLPDLTPDKDIDAYQRVKFP